MACLIGVKDAKPASAPELDIRAIKAKSIKIIKRIYVPYADSYLSINPNWM